MQVRFLLGPAGSGKTYGCLAEIRSALLAAPEGAPLILLAPKQSTFQLERQLLAHPALPGYTRLFIVSFERLAHLVLSACGQPGPRLISETGRLMVLRGILTRGAGEMRFFGRLARKPGFVAQLDLLLREFQAARFTPAKIRSLLQSDRVPAVLRDKLHDAALVHEAFGEWLAAQGLEDSGRLLESAANALEQAGVASSPEATGVPQFDGVWLDGFARLTEQELELLVSLISRCQQATLAFCLDTEPRENPHWLSSWSTVSQTYLRLRNRLLNLPGIDISVIRLERDPSRTRFQSSRELRRLEQGWSEGVSTLVSGDSDGAPEPQAVPGSGSIRVIQCRDPQVECRTAAREVLKHAQEGGRYRDMAVLVRRLELYQDWIGREFRRYGIPFFLDRREPVGRHPLAELTRGALKLLAHGWRHEDWFGVLKTGLVIDDELAIDQLENEALARGWCGDTWWKPFPGTLGDHDLAGLENLRRQLVAPFQRLARRLSVGGDDSLSGITGVQLADALRTLWRELEVEERLQSWPNPNRGMPFHTMIWDQANDWLDMVELAFGSEPMSLVEWLPVVESGLASLTVGVVPPALDQVLVGGIDRSRNPELGLVLLLGLNESVFPAASDASLLLTEGERTELDRLGVPALAGYRQHLSHEWFLGYIACTRSSQRLVLTFAQRSASGEPLNPSPLVGHVRRLVPGLAIEWAPPAVAWTAVIHEREFIAPLLQTQHPRRAGDHETRILLGLALKQTGLQTLWARIQDFESSLRQQCLSPETVGALWEGGLSLGVHVLEQFAACPFQFFVANSLRARERARFDPDPLRSGSLAHALLQEFHRRLAEAKTRWRDVSPRDARLIVSGLGEELLGRYANGLFAQGAQARFQGRVVVWRVGQLIEALVRWTAQYAFDPVAAELGFGLEDSPLPGWVLALGDQASLTIRGSVDRVDLWCHPSGEFSYLAIYDYKTRAYPPDPVLVTEGIEVQLFAYLSALSELKPAAELLGSSALVPAGAFYIGLLPDSISVENRREALDPTLAASSQHPYQHVGWFRADALRAFDTRAGATRGDQFRYAFKKDGTPALRGNDAKPPRDFEAFLGKVRARLVHLGHQILGGRILAEPYRWKGESACDACPYRAICRFDPSIYAARLLRPEPNQDLDG